MLKGQRSTLYKHTCYWHAKQLDESWPCSINHIQTNTLAKIQKKKSVWELAEHNTFKKTMPLWQHWTKRTLSLQSNPASKYTMAKKTFLFLIPKGTIQGTGQPLWNATDWTRKCYILSVWVLSVTKPTRKAGIQEGNSTYWAVEYYYMHTRECCKSLPNKQSSGLYSKANWLPFHAEFWIEQTRLKFNRSTLAYVSNMAKLHVN